MSAYFGLDFGSSSLKLVQVDLAGAKSFTVRAIGWAPNVAGSLDFADPQVAQKLRAAVKQLMTDAKVKEKRVVVTVPESQVFSRIVAMPSMSDAELSSAIMWEAEQFVPIPIADVEIDYSVVKQSPKGSNAKMLVYLVAAPKKQLQALVDFLLSCGLDPIAVESEMVAVSRAITFGENVVPSMVVNVGALSTIIGIVENSSLVFSYVMNIGGVAMTRALSQGLSLPLPQAEEYKRTYGLDPNQLEGKVRAALLIPMNQVVSELRKAMEYYANEQKAAIARIYVSGGGAYLPELTGFLTNEFTGVEVVLADVFRNARPAQGVILPKDKATYTAAVGLAMRVF